jgi:hypothetical protein
LHERWFVHDGGLIAMNEEEREAHYHLIRQSMRMPFCRHVLVNQAHQHEWHRVRLKLTVIQRVVPHLLFAAFILFFTAGKTLEHRVAIVLGVALLIELVLRLHFRGATRDVVIELDAPAGVLRAPLAGLEIETSHVTGFALRVVRHLLRGQNELIRHPADYLCLYVRMADGSFIPLVAESLQQSPISGFQAAARSFAAAVDLPLMEPEAHHQPTPINPAT